MINTFFLMSLFYFPFPKASEKNVGPLLLYGFHCSLFRKMNNDAFQSYTRFYEIMWLIAIKLP